MADAEEKDEDVFHVDDEEGPKSEVVVIPEMPAEKVKIAVVVPEAPLTFPDGTTAKDLAMELITLREVQQGIGQSCLPGHLTGITKVTALKRYEQICEILGKIQIK